MKKSLVIISIIILTFSFAGCSSNKSKETKATSSSSSTSIEVIKEEVKKVEAKKELNTQTIDGLTLTVTSKIEAIKGDRTKDNVGDTNGEYIAVGSDIVMANGYKKIEVFVDIKNDTDKTVQMGVFYWGAELQDGYKLNQTITGDQKDDQVQSKSNGKYEFYYTVKNDIKADKLKLTYLWVKNEDEFKKLVADPNTSKMSEQEATKKYKDVYIGLKFETDIQK